MIPVTQTKVVVRNSNGDIVQNGNCWASAIASILELPLSEVPNFEVWFQWNDTFWYHLTNRFIHKKGYHLEYCREFRLFHPEIIKEEFKDAPPFYDIEEEKEKLKDQYYFVTGPSSRGVSHVVIYQNGIMVHDPHPSREGLLELESFERIRLLTEEERLLVEDPENKLFISFPSPFKVNKN